MCERRWFSGKISRCQRDAPGSIPGRRMRYTTAVRDGLWQFHRRVAIAAESFEWTVYMFAKTDRRRWAIPRLLRLQSRSSLGRKKVVWVTGRSAKTNAQHYVIIYTWIKIKNIMVKSLHEPCIVLSEIIDVLLCRELPGSPKLHAMSQKIYVKKCCKMTSFESRRHALSRRDWL